MSDEKKPEPLTLTIVIEYEDGEYYARIAGSGIFGDGKTPAAALLSLASAYCATEGWESEKMLRGFAQQAKQQQKKTDAAVLEQTNAGYAALREREQKTRRLREAVGDKADALAAKLESNLVPRSTAKRANK